VAVVGWNANGPILVVELGVATAAGSSSIWDVAVWDSATWGRDTVWTDITEYVREMDITRGRSRATEYLRYAVGTMSAVLSNADDRFNPINNAGPYVTGGRSQIKPRVPIRVQAWFEAGSGYVIVPLFYGFVDVWQDQFPGQKDATTYIECTDVLSVFARFNGPEQPSAGAGEALGARAIRIADNAGFTGDITTQAGSVTLQATTLAGNALTELTLATDTEVGAFFATGANEVRILSADGVLEQLAGQVNATFGGSGISGIAYSDPQFIYDADLVYNIVSFARAGGTQQTAQDPDSRAEYGDLAYSRSDLIADNDPDVAAAAEVFLARFLAPEYRVAAVTVYPMTATDAAPYQSAAGVFNGLWHRVLSRQLLDPVRVEATTPGGTDLNQVSYIDGITHSIRPRQWVTTFNFGSAEAYQAFGTSNWDEGLWDEALWLFG
jgi:hypothetical protein